MRSNAWESPSRSLPSSFSSSSVPWPTAVLIWVILPLMDVKLASILRAAAISSRTLPGSTAVASARAKSRRAQKRAARYASFKGKAPQPTIGKVVDDAMSAIERDNPSLKGVLPKDYARPGLDKQRLGQLINLVSDIGLGSPADRAKDILGRVYEYFLAQFASAEGKKGGQFENPPPGALLSPVFTSPERGSCIPPQPGQIAHGAF